MTGHDKVMTAPNVDGQIDGLIECIRELTSMVAVLHRRVEQLEKLTPLQRLTDVVGEGVQLSAALLKRVERLEKAQARTADVASCLANGIQPD